MIPQEILIQRAARFLLWELRMDLPAPCRAGSQMRRLHPVPNPESSGSGFGSRPLSLLPFSGHLQVGQTAVPQARRRCGGDPVSPQE